jgi:NADH-quinone oxidoreductase subunit M
MAGFRSTCRKYALFFMLFTMASSACRAPAASSASSCRLQGIYKVSTWATLICTTGIILGAAYMLYLYRRVAFGEQKNADAAAMPDLDKRELWLLAPIAAAVLWMGVYPESFLAPIRPTLRRLSTALSAQRPAGDSKLKEHDKTTAKYRVTGSMVEHEEKPAEGAQH